MAGSLYVIEESRRSTVIYASHEDKVLNKFGIWKERHVQMGENRASRLVGCKTHPTILPRSGFELTTSRTPQLQTWSKCPKLLTTRPRRNIVRSCHWTQSLYSCWQSLCKKIGYKLAKLTGHMGQVLLTFLALLRHTTHHVMCKQIKPPVGIA